MWIQHTQKKTAMVNIDTKNSKRKNCLKKCYFHGLFIVLLKPTMGMHHVVVTDFYFLKLAFRQKI